MEASASCIADKTTITKMHVDLWTTPYASLAVRKKNPLIKCLVRVQNGDNA